jgi:hypothetical protein
MTSDSPEIQALTERLARVEKQNRRLKNLMGTVGFALLVLFLNGQLHQRVEAANGAGQVLETQGLHIKDPSGRLRASIDASDKSVAIVFYDTTGQQQLAIVAGSDATGVTLSHSGKTRLALAVSKDGDANLIFADSKSPRAMLALTHDGPSLNFYNPEGDNRGSLFATDSSWGLVLYNPDSSKGAAFIVSGLGSAAMLMNKKGYGGIAAMASEEANYLAVSDLETNRTSIELKNNGQASMLRFLDGNATDRVTIGLTPASGAAILLNDLGSKTRTALWEENPGLAIFDAEGSFVWSAGFDGLSKEDQKAIRLLMDKSRPHR